MRDGFLKVAAATPKIKVADPQWNSGEICRLIEEGKEQGIKVLVFPELALTAYTCGDLFMQKTLIKGAEEGLLQVMKATEGSDIMVFVGLPWENGGKLYNAAAAVQNGCLLGVITKINIPNYSEFYERRYFEPGIPEVKIISWNGIRIPFGGNILFECENMKDLVIGAEICEDLWVACPPGARHAEAGATVIVNCSASDETTGKSNYRRSLIAGQSSRLVCGYIYSNAGDGESTQDLVFGGHCIIGENGTLLRESSLFDTGLTKADLDLERISAERRRISTFRSKGWEDYWTVSFNLNIEDVKLERFIDPAPFVPAEAKNREKRCEEIFGIQAMGLKKRLEHTGCSHAVIGISGGLDSTLALLVTAKAFDLMGIPREQIHCITMPCFGTTDRTYKNACTMTKRLGAQLREIDIKEAVNQHFKDIEHDPGLHNVTYENSQARERTQVLMDVANQVNGMVIGTGDMSELALGWATYNGDHMSMYGVNASVPKTLVRHLVRYCADTCREEELKNVLYDVLDTPVSPELLPPEDGNISQKTEDLVGPYELHDFYLFHILRYGSTPGKVYRLAVQAFYGQYESQEILKWLKVFYRRFFSQQFKRSCLPDGPKVGSVAVSPRGDLRMPSDASARLWLEELEKL
ncbi:NAD(+) synthase [Lachnoclostridium edouardi]|uniref:NAD(+) synthase n=1 Tax=Lachnoclostridium edouardi TaxID=1926283 RepID=UPI000C7B661A|nr:NAD(+) synthase [Lachnoclostridium edouardi]MDO4279101.1 NAD(+) synthase [Lachnoclostridium edouardi]